MPMGLREGGIASAILFIIFYWVQNDSAEMVRHREKYLACTAALYSAKHRHMGKTEVCLEACFIGILGF